MNRSLVLFTICIVASGINGRPQATLPLFGTPFSPVIIPNRLQSIYMRPGEQIIFLTDGLPMNFNGVPKPSMQMPMPMLFPMPGPPPRGSYLPLALWPYFNNQFNSPMGSNGLYKQRATTPATSILSENKTEVSTTIQTEVVSETPTTANESLVDLTSPKPTTVAAVEVAQQSDGDYNFEYSVNNLPTGDVKSHEETRLNGVVTGYYMMLEADGTIRKVNYTADAENGFRAIVSKIPVPINK
ncbi:uncharacterized protein LOC124327275 isoform X2 [Daphnia pulicaria]|uniref:uncharacterized protein LOC124327275 isoform X2 n=1 Tax=Daphnia pulicaria TaxID=35523 RepID=UPI001EEAB7EB|nr:uncharacterized protein LOC124327275 isoform X2 [Daphnia pulicaria]